MSEKFENTALFLRLGQLSMLLFHENRAFQKRSSNWRNFKTPNFHFSMDKKQFEKKLFQNYDILIIM